MFLLWPLDMFSRDRCVFEYFVFYPEPKSMWTRCLPGIFLLDTRCWDNDDMFAGWTRVFNNCFHKMHQLILCKTWYMYRQFSRLYWQLSFLSPLAVNFEDRCLPMQTYYGLHLRSKLFDIQIIYRQNIWEETLIFCIFWKKKYLKILPSMPRVKWLAGLFWPIRFDLTHKTKVCKWVHIR